MRNRKNHEQSPSQKNFPKNPFLPMLCSKPSVIKDVSLPNHDDHHKSYTSFTATDPASPRVSCMGQVKRHNNRVIAFPASTTGATTANNINYFKLRKLFSSKNLIAVTSTNNSSSRRGHRRSQTAVDDSRFGFNDIRSIDVADLDPPLPVIKKVRNGEDCGGDGENLWRRRRTKSGGVALRNLQIQQIQIPNQIHQARSV